MLARPFPDSLGNFPIIKGSLKTGVYWGLTSPVTGSDERQFEKAERFIEI